MIIAGREIAFNRFFGLQLDNWLDLLAALSGVLWMRTHLDRKVMRQAERDLADGLTGFEAECLRLSFALQELAPACDKIVSGIQARLRLSVCADTGEPVFNRAIALLDSPLAFSARIGPQISPLREKLTKALETVETLIRVGAELRQTVSPLAVLQHMYKIECASLSQEDAILFRSVVSEMDRMQQRLVAMVAVEFGSIASAREMLKGVLAHLETLEESQKAAAEHRELIDVEIQTVRTRLAEGEQRSAELTRLMNDLREDVGRVVVSMQFQDILSQRIRHVIAGSREIRAAVREAAALHRIAESLTFAVSASRIESSQLTAVDAQIDEAASGVRAGTQSILSRIDCLEQERLRLSEGELAEGGTIQILLAAIQQTRALISSTADSLEQMGRELAPLGESSGKLSDNIIVLSSQMQQLVLNAQIHSARNGGHTGLDVLSNRTAEITMGISRSIEELACELAGLKNTLDAAVSACSALARDAGAQRTALDASGSMEENRLAIFRDRSEKLLADAGAQAAEMRRNITLLNQIGSSAEALLQHTAPLRSILLQIADGLAPKIERIDANVCSERLRGMAQRYSMHAERLVHDGHSQAEESTSGSVELF